MGVAHFTRAKHFSEKVAFFAQIHYYYPSSAENSSFACHQKKVLALVLAFACAFTMFAGAAFTDSADIKATEAVDMLTALGVIDGYEDGSFKPEATITRAEAAKMIYTIRNGGNDNASAFEGSSVFTDVYKGHWAAGYINFCYANGIVDGKAKNAFKPDDKVTGTELAKMLLICMGYQADKSGLTGAAWSQKTNGLASQNGLYDDVTASVSAAMPRQYAAQIMFNALEADTVQWSSDVNGYEKVKTTGLEWKENPNDATDGSWVNVEKNETMGKKWMKLDTVENVLLSSVKQESGKSTFNLNNGAYTKVEDDCSALLGQRVNILLKDNDKSKVYGVYANDDSKVVATGYAGQLELDGSEKVKMDGTSYKLDSADNKKGNLILTANTNTYKTGFDTIVKAVGEKGSMDKNAAASSIKLIDNDGDGKVDTALHTPAKVGKVTAVSKSSVTVNNGINTVKFDDAEIYDGIAKDDYVMFVAEANRSSEDKDSITKLDVTSAKVTGTRTGEAKVNDEWVKLAKDVKVESGNSYDMVIVGGVLLFADETKSVSKDILYISGTKEFDGYAGEKYGTKEVRAYFADGSNKTIKVSKLAGDKIAKAKNVGTDYADEAGVKAGQMYTYSKLSDETYDIEALSTKNDAGYDKIVTGKSDAYSKQKIDGLAPQDDAVIFVQTGKETKVLTGKQIKNWADSITNNFTAAYGTKESNGIDYVAVAALVNNASENVPGATKDTLYGYLTADAYVSDKDGEDKATYEVWTTNGAKTLYADTKTVEKNATAGAVISYTVNGDYIESIKVNAGIQKGFAAVAVTGFDYKAEGELAFVSETLGAKQYTLDEDCVFLTVDDENTAGVEGNSLDQIQLANAGSKSTSDKETVLTNAYVVIGGDNNDKVLAVIIDTTNNELDAAKELYKKDGSVVK